MGAFLIYMLKSAVCLLLFYVFFKAFLSQDTFFRFNRFVLLGGMLVCLLLPSVHLEITGQAKVICARMGEFEKRWQESYPPGEKAVDEVSGKLVSEVGATDRWGEVLSVRGQAEERAAFVSLGSLLMFIYLLGALGVCIWLAAAFLKIIRLLRHSRKKSWGKYTLALTATDVCPFSWGKYIVLSDKDYDTSSGEILVHEKVHADKGHTLDLCFTELILIIQWFNPAVWLLKKELQEIHEYEADNGVIDQGIDATKYQLLLVKKAVGARLYSIANSFNHSKLKNRITMMLKEKSNRWARLKVLVLVPPAALLMLAFARPVTVTSDAGTFKVMQIPEKNKGPEQNLSPDSLARELENYLQTESLKQISAKEKEMLEYHFSRSVPKNVEWVNLLMNRNNEVLFKDRPVRIEQVPDLLESWKNEKLKDKPIYLYLKKDRDTSPQAWAKLLTMVKEMYDKVEQRPGAGIRVVISEPRHVAQEVFIHVITYENEKRKTSVSVNSLKALEDLMNEANFGRQGKIRINIGTGPATAKAKELAGRIIEEKGLTNVTVFVIPPPPPPNPVIWLKMKGEGQKDEFVLAWNLKQFESRLDKVANLKQYTSFELEVKRQKNDNLKNQVLQKLRERGITGVKIIGTDIKVIKR